MIEAVLVEIAGLILNNYVCWSYKFVKKLMLNGCLGDSLL